MSHNPAKKLDGMVVIDSPAIKNGTLIKMDKDPIFKDDSPEVKAAKILKLWHDYGQVDMQVAKHFGINRVTVKNIIEEIKSTTIYTQYLTEMHDSLDGMFSNSFKVNLFERIKKELDEQREAMQTCKRKITEINKLKLSPDGEIDRATNKGTPITNAEKRTEKKYWRGQLQWHTNCYHKLLAEVMRENSKWVMKGLAEPSGKTSDMGKPAGESTHDSESALLKDRSLQ